MSAEVGSAHIAIFPVMRGFKKAVAAEVKGSASEGRIGFQRAFSGAGQAIGQRLGRETAAGFKQATGSMGGDGLRKLRTDVAAAIIEITAEEAGVEAAGVTPASRFADDLDIDSLGLLTIATQVEERLGVTLDDSLIPNLPTVGALIDLVSTQRA